MPDGNQPSQEGAGYEAQDANLASAGEPERMTRGFLEEEREGPKARDLDARDERFGRRKPMGPTAGTAVPTIPEGIAPTEEKPRARRRKGDK